MPKVVFVADDFGQTPGINRAVIDTFERGIVGSASVVINGRYAEEAVFYSKKHPDLETGIHLALVSEKPVLPVDEIPSLIDPKTKLFYANRYLLLSKFILRQISLSEIKREFEAQIIKFKGEGLNCQFLNSHDHLHFFPSLFPMVIELCREHGIPYIRIPNEKLNLNLSSLITEDFWKGFLGYRNLARVVLRILYLAFNRRLSQIQVKGPDHFQGLLYNCVNSVQSLTNIITSLKPGLTEVICHPAYEDEIYKTLPSYKAMRSYRRDEETKALCSPTIRMLLKKYDVENTTFSNMEK